MRVTLIFVLLAITALFRFGTDLLAVAPEAEPIVALGFIILFSFLIGKMVARFGMPMITGYLIAGIIAGPQFLNILSEMTTDKLHLIDELALGIIALTAGGELRIPTLKEQSKSLSYIVIYQILFVFLGVTVCFALFFGVSHTYFDYSFAQMLVIVLFLGTTAMANSPATAIAVITESQASGPMTDRVVGVTVVKDVVVLSFFTLAMALSRILLSQGNGSILGDFLHLFWSVAGAFLFGGAIGLLIILFLKYVGEDTPIFLLGMVFAATELSQFIQVEFIMACVAAGFVVENFSSFGEDLIQSIEQSSLPVYVIFFSIAGASLDLRVLFGVWYLALLIVSVRMLTTWWGSKMGSRLAGDSVAVQKYVWTGFVGQAGVTLGMAVLVGKAFADSFGAFLQTLIISGIVINQLVGPVLFRIGLERAGEIGQKRLRH